MKKLSNTDWEHSIVMDDGSSTLLVIENPAIFRSYIAGIKLLLDGEDSNFVLSDGIKVLKPKDHIDIIFSPFSISFSDKRISTKIQSSMKEMMVSEDHYPKTMEILSNINSYSSSLSSDFDVPLEWEEPTSADLLKLIGYSVKTEYEDDLEKVLEYMNVMHDLCGIDDFVFISLFGYFSQKEIDSIVFDSQGNKHNLLFIEPRQPETLPANTKLIIIDNDGCEIF